MYQHPIFALVLAVFVALLIIEESIIKVKLQKVKLLLAFFNVFFIVLMWLFYDSQIQDTSLELAYSIILISEYVLFGVVISIIAFVFLQKTRNYNNFIDAFKNTTFNVYYLTDKKDRIKEISDSLLKEIGQDRKSVIGKKAFDVFDKTIRFNRINDLETTNNELRDYYKKFPKTAIINEEYKREVYFLDPNGQNVVLNLLEKPIFISGKYRGRMNVGQKKNDLSLLSIEKELISRNEMLESIQYKFIASLELTQSGIFFYDLNEDYLWGNDIFVSDLGLSSNTILSSDYYGLIHQADLLVYQDVLDKLTAQNPSYQVTYRFKVGVNYKYVTEKGKRIFDDPTTKTILGYTSVAKTSHFAVSNYKELDAAKNIDELMVDLTKMFEEHRIFEIININLTNLAEINERFSRTIGDMVLGEYIKQISENFITDSSNLYRISGCNFIFILTDTRKIDLFKKALVSDSEAMNLKMQYGSLNVHLKVNMGISQSNVDGMDAKSVVDSSKEALKLSLNPNYKYNYVYAKEVRNV